MSVDMLYLVSGGCDLHRVRLSKGVEMLDLISLDKEGFVSVQDLSDFELAEVATADIEQPTRAESLKMAEWLKTLKPFDSL
mgnify:CR=1 FL=1